MTKQIKLSGLFGSGLRTASTRWKAVLILYLASLIPALAVAVPAFLTINEDLSDRPYAQEALGGYVWGMWSDYTNSDAYDLGAILGVIPLLIVFGAVLQILVGAGVAGMLVSEGERGFGAFFDGVVKLSGRFLRSAVAFAVTLFFTGIVFAMSTGIAGKIAENARDERWRLWGFAFGVLAALFVLIPMDLSYDLSRISAAFHNGRRTFTGFFRTLLAVVRRPGTLVPLYLGFLGLILALHLLYLLLRQPWSAASWLTILLAVILQQALMLARAYVKVSFWGSEIAFFQSVDEPAWCGGEASKPAADASSTAVPAAVGERGEEVPPALQSQTLELLTPKSGFGREELEEVVEASAPRQVSDDGVGEGVAPAPSKADASGGAAESGDTPEAPDGPKG